MIFLANLVMHAILLVGKYKDTVAGSYNLLPNFLLSNDQEARRQVKPLFLRSPTKTLSSFVGTYAGTFTRAASVIGFHIRDFSFYLQKIMDWIGNGEFLAHNTMLNYVTKIACELNHMEMKRCEDFLFILCGHDPYQFKMVR